MRKLLFILALLPGFVWADGGYVFTPSILPTPPFIGVNQSPTTVAALAAANDAYLLSTYVPTMTTVTGIRMNIGTSAGNIDVGIYDANGNKVVSKGSTACPSGGSQTVSFASPTTLIPGQYWIAIAADGTSATFARAGTNSPGGCILQTSDFPLHSTMTLPGTATTTCYALMGIVTGGITK